MDRRSHSTKATRTKANLDMLRGSLKIVFRAPAEPCFTELLQQFDRRAAT